VNSGRETAAARCPLLELAGVTKVYGEGRASLEALRGIDLSVDEGEFVAIMGPSGSGKSTIMHILGCLDVPTRGDYLFRGAHVERLSRRQRALLRRHYLGFVFQGFNLLARTSALENVELPLVYRGESRRSRHAAASAALDSVGLTEWAAHTPSELSGGQQQRVAIARALANDPGLLVADEPTGNLDSQTAAQVFDLFRQLAAQGKTIVMVTHDRELAARADQVIPLADGKLQ
jgi:putative ABC transport system ATP-binding protein